MPLYSQNGYGRGKYGIGDTGLIYSLPVSYYLNLLTSEYRLAPNLNSWLGVLLSPLNDTTNMLMGLTESFDLDSAVGIQLDTCGAIAGVSRTVGFQPSGGVSPVLDDTTYRLLIKATIVKNQWDGTNGSLQPTWQALLQGGTIENIDNQNMTATIVLSGAFTSVVKDLISNGYIVPRKATVQYTYTFAEQPLFGTDLSTALIAGVDTGHLV
jgi:hypothetical protein